MSKGNDNLDWEEILSILIFMSVGLLGNVILFYNLQEYGYISIGTAVYNTLLVGVGSFFGLNIFCDYVAKRRIRKEFDREYKARQARIAEQECQRQVQRATQGGQTSPLTQAVNEFIEQRRGHVPVMNRDRIGAIQTRTKSNKELLFEKYEELLMDLLKVNSVDINGYGEEVNVMENNQLVTSFRIRQLPGCCGVGVSTGVEVREQYRNKGVSTLMNKFRQEYAKLLSYGVLMCTDVETNIAQQKVLEKNKWKKLHSFRNPKTSNQVAIHLIDLN
jgi:hypothetical protein